MGRKCCQNTFKRVVTFELDLLFAQQTKRHNYISPELSWGWVLMVLMIWLSVKCSYSYMTPDTVSVLGRGMPLLQIWQFPYLQKALPRNDVKWAEAVAESGAAMCYPGELTLSSGSESPC